MGQAVGMRSVNENGINLIKKFEGLSLTVYICPANKKTVGFGHLTDKELGQEITKAQADEFLLEDLKEAQLAVSELVRVPLSENEYAALVSFVFNIGRGNFERSTLLKYLNKGWKDQVPQQLMRWNKVKGVEMGGLSRRRQAEVLLWNTP